MGRRAGGQAGGQSGSLADKDIQGEIALFFLVDAAN
jgi:hypothetical protein